MIIEERHVRILSSTEDAVDLHLGRKNGRVTRVTVERPKRLLPIPVSEDVGCDREVRVTNTGEISSVKIDGVWCKLPSKL